jgi:hypothetical protein
MKGKNQGNDPENLPKINPIWGKPALHSSIAARRGIKINQFMAGNGIPFLSHFERCNPRGCIHCFPSTFFKHHLK